MPTLPPTSTRNLLLRFRRYYMLALVLLFAGALANRWSGIGLYPQPHRTDDEYDYLWGGMSILNGDPPVGWSFLKGLPQENLLGHYWMGKVRYPMYQYYFDHPPLFQVATAVTAKLAGVNARAVSLEDPDGSMTLWFVKLKKLRVLPLLLFAISFVLLWKWLRATVGPVAALIALSILSFIDNFVAHHRLVVADNMVVPCMLGIFVMLTRWKRGRSRTRVAALTVVGLAAAAVLTKLVALMLVPGVVAWACACCRGKRALQPIAWVTVGAGLGLAGYVGFACMHSPEAFIATMRSHSGRFQDFYGIARMIGAQVLVITREDTGWIIGGWILFFAYALRQNLAGNALFAAGMGLMFGYVFFAPADWYGWHVVPFYPFLAAGWGIGIRGALRRPGGPQAILLLYLLVTEVFSSQMLPARYLSAARYAYIGVGGLLFFPWGFRCDAPRRLVLRALVIFLLAAGLTLQLYKTRWVQWQIENGTEQLSR